MKPGPAIQLDLKKVEALAAGGLTMEQIAKSLGISDRTLRNRKHDYAGFSEAIEKGQAKGLAIVTNKLFEMAKEGNLGAICFYLKNRAGWSDRQKIEATGANGTPLIPSLNVHFLGASEEEVKTLKE